MEKQTPTKVSINLIINGSNNLIYVDSRQIAKEFGRPHKNVLAKIHELLADGTISPLETKPRKYVKRGRFYPCYELNDAGFLKAMPFIGGQKSKEGQKRLVDELLKLRRQLDLQTKEKATLAYQVARLKGKDSRAILVETIREFIEYAHAQGSQNANRYYSNITKVVYSAMLVIEPKAEVIRELLNSIQLSNLSTLELTTAKEITDGMEANQPYKGIYQNVKSALNGVLVVRGKLLE